MRRSTTFARLFREQGSLKAVRLMSRRQWKYPAATEHKYARMVRDYLDNAWKGYAEAWLRAYVPSRSDALEDLWPEDATRSPVLGAIITLAEDLDKFNKQEWDAFKKIAVGAAFSEDDPWVQPVIDEWAQTQVTLITKASQDMQDAVARRVRKGVATGAGTDEIRSLIMRDLPGISFRRAQIIARDQCAKLNSALSQGRMEQAGIETYIWSTSMDERVRGLPGGKYADAVPSHYLMEGKVCRWDDPTKCKDANGDWVARPPGAPTLHPGQDIMCRCVALPNWAELDELADLTPEERAQTELESAQEALARATTAASYVDPSNPAYKEFERAAAEAQKFLDSLKAAAPSVVPEKVVEQAAKKVAIERILQTEHPKRTQGQKPQQFMIDYYGLSESVADRYLDAIDSYTANYYKGIRDYQKGRDISARPAMIDRYKQWGEDLEQFIGLAPKWSGGPTYRGFSTSSERLQELIADMANGTELNMGGTSSWSTSYRQACQFSGIGSGDKAVVLECRGIQRGTSIQTLSGIRDEEEVLVSKNARYKITGTRQEGNLTIFEVEEVSDGW